MGITNLQHDEHNKCSLECLQFAATAFFPLEKNGIRVGPSDCGRMWVLLSAMFLVNASLPKPLHVAVSNFSGTWVKGTGQHFV